MATSPSRTDAKASKAKVKSDAEYQIRCLDKNVKRIARALKPHKKRVKEYTRRERAYKGDIDYDRDTWRHQVHPPYIFQNIQTLEAQLVWDATLTKVYPTKAGDEQAADALEKLLKVQMEKDGLDQKWGQCLHDALVLGIGVGKIHWGQRLSTATYDDDSEETVVSFDQPTFDVIDPRNFFLDPSAASIAEAEYACFRYFCERDWIEKMGEKGPNGEPSRWFNVEEALDSRGNNEGTEDKPGKSHIRNQTDLDLDREYEIIEVWTRDRVVVIVNQDVLVQDDKSPFDHGELPFIDLYTIEDPHHFDKLSVVDTGIELQNARWEFGNQGLDAASLLNNPVVKVMADVDDPDDYQVQPGAIWLMDRPEDVMIESWDNRIISGMRQIDEWLDQTMQAVMAANPFGPSTPDQQVSPITAAEVNAETSVAQTRITRARSLLGYSRKRLGKLWIALDQQFLTEPVEVRMIGQNGVAFHHVDPSTIQGQFDYFIESQQESTDRQQRRTEWINMFTTVANMCGGVGQMEAMGFSVNAFWEKLASAFDILNPEHFYDAAKAAQAAQQAQMQAQMEQAAAAAPPTAAPPAQ